MSRFHIATALTVLLLAAWLAAGATRVSPAIPAALVAIYFIVTAAGVAFPQMSFFGHAICRGPTDVRRIALTFDDGPRPYHTPLLLDILKEHGVPATFFCTGRNVDAFPDLARRIAAEGHSLQNHTYNHHPLTNFFSTRHLVHELNAAQRAISMASGSPPRFYRPPMGLTNPRVFKALRTVGLTAVGWTARAFVSPWHNPTQAADALFSALQPGAILVMHDDKFTPEAMAEALRLLIGRAREAGFEFVTLDTLLDGGKRTST